MREKSSALKWLILRISRILRVTHTSVSFPGFCALTSHFLAASQVLKVPKSDVEIAKGMKSREKTVMVHNLAKNRNAEEHIELIRNALIESLEH